MRGAALLLFLQLAVYSRQQDVTPASVKEAFIEAKIVPDVLDSFDPVVLLDVTYSIPGTEEQKAVTPPGRNFTAPETLYAPTYSIPSDYEKLCNETFVVIMVDPDAPTPQNPILAEVRHFVGGDYHLQGPPSPVPGAVLVNSTPALTEYLPAAPPSYSDPHRYVWVLYFQPPDFPTSISSSIFNFSLEAFASEYNLGPPLAGNYMTVSTNPEALAAAGEH